MTLARQPLSPERFRQVQSLFEQIVAVPVDARTALIATVCGCDTGLHEEVASLVHAFERASGGWERSAAEHLSAGSGAGGAGGILAASQLVAGSRVGPYVIGRKIGEGGMGAVFEGIRADDTYQSRVAIKTLIRGLGSAALARRFVQERQILARLQHPNIAALHDGGATEHGAPFLVMEFVDGLAIDDFCAAQRATIEQRLDLFRQVCTAIQFAHRKLVVHRDLKPSNILVTNDGIVKVLDFGIAKLLDPAADERAGVTQDGLVPLTSAYASPEQSRGDEITTATDVYSLGVILYRLLVGTAPYDVERKTPAEVRAILSEQVPAPPSTVANEGQALASGLANAAALRRTLTGELDAIVMMALRKEPERRYPSVEALSDDILRYLKELPVVARPDTIGYRVRSFVRRQRALVIGGTIAALALVVGTVVSVRQAQSAREQARRASRVTQYLQAIVGAADPSHYSALRTGKKDVALMEVLDSTRSRVGQDLANEPRIRADLYWSMGNAYRAFGRHGIALTLLDSARDLHAMTVGARAVEVARDVHFSGVVLQDVGRFDEATTRFRDAKARYEALPAPPDTEVTDVLLSLGQVLGIALNQYGEGERLLREAERRELTSRSPRQALTGLIQSALGTTLTQGGSYAAADSAFQRAVASYSQDSIRARFERSYALTNWGMLLTRQGRFDDAARIKRRALIDIVMSLGTDNISTVRVQQRLADDLLQIGRVGEARQLADSALAELGQLSTPHPLEWTQSLRVRGTVSTREGRLEEAERYLDRAATQLAQLSGSGKVGAEVALATDYGRLYEAQNKEARAAASFQKAYEVALSGLGTTNYVTLAALGRLAAFARRAGDVGRADSLIADSLRTATAAGAAK